MEDIIENLRVLSNRSSQIIIYKTDIKNIVRGIGRIMGKFDQELFEFLKFSNGASVFDYCFLGFKNSKLGVDIDKYAMELWASNNRLAGHFLPFMLTSTSDNFGYLIDMVDDKGCHPIAYYSTLNNDSIYVIGSSFKEFMKTFLNDIKETLDSSGKDDILINVSSPDWPIMTSHWLAGDEVLRKNLRTIQQVMKNHMPDTNFF